MRPLPFLQQRRAVWLSLCAHATLATVLLFARSGDEAIEPGAIVQAELVVLRPSRGTPMETVLEQQPPETKIAVTDAVEAEPAASIAAPPPPAEPVAPAATPEEPAPVAPPAPDVTPQQEARDSASAEPLPSAPAELADALPAHEDTAIPALLEPAVADRVRRRLDSWTGRFSPDAPSPTLEWRDAGQRYTATLTRPPAEDPMAMERLEVTVSTERDGARLVTQLEMTRVAFSNFAQFIDRWDPNVQIHDDVIDGRFHSNSEIRVSRGGGVRPIFNGKVTLAARDFASDGTGFIDRRKIFPAGIETGVSRIVLPSRAAAFDADAVPAHRTHRIARDASLAFAADGSYEWRYSDTSESGRRVLDDEPFYVVAAENASLSVSGVVNGKVLVYSTRRIVVDGDLRYADDPRTPGASDYLGLVAERTVEIDDPEVTGPGDLTIHASIYARQRFQVRSYRSRPSGTLHIFGSVTAGSVSATEPRYATKIEFDERLTTMRAPGFPLSDRYELESWSGEWRIVEGD